MSSSSVAALRVASLLLAALLARPQSFSQAPDTLITKEAVANAERLIGIPFTDAERDSMLEGLRVQAGQFIRIRSIDLPNSIPPAVQFNPIPLGYTKPAGKRSVELSAPKLPQVPTNLEELAFSSVGELAALVKSRKVTSRQLTEMYLSRLKKHGPTLLCVVTVTESLALSQADRADREIAGGRYRGPLHGIPYGAKDLLATRGVPTTWGSVPYKDQVIADDATVVRKLEEAGAVLVAKLTLGELAWGDVWFGGKTRNPWNIEQGSSGSSAGSAAATAAGLVAFAIGTETYGSIVSPSTRCGTTGLRPTYGLVSRAGAMALSWSMDKIGPICRSVEDCAIVVDAIDGADGIDQAVIDVPFRYGPLKDFRAIRVGYLKADFDSATSNRSADSTSLALLRSLGANLIPVQLPAYPVGDLDIILSAEAAAAFDELTRSGRDDLMVRQIKDAWPNVFRHSRFIPAVEYIQANRVRYKLIQEMAGLMNGVDILVAPSLEGGALLTTNLTGHPCVVLPNGMTEKGTPTSITFLGRLYDEGRLLAFAKRYQDATGFHLRRPPSFDPALTSQ